MNTPSSTPNGARLDDCHSTIFSLADLSGIKWQKYSSLTASFSDDPVLSAFTWCLSHDILAVWRRSPKKNSSIDVHETFEKELWIFWWGDEPQIEEITRHKGLTDKGSGCWEEGLSYECRTLLFKAIHNLVERCLLNEQFVRIGRWFIKPLCKDGDEDISSVCTTVEVAKHQNLERLSCQHLQQLHSAGRSSKSVVLAPYGLEAKLTGRVYRSPHEPVVRRLLEEWKPFYPFGNVEDVSQDDVCSDEDGTDDHIPVPPVVEIVVGDVQMNYPSHYILVPLGKDVDDAGDSQHKFYSPSGKGKSGPSPGSAGTPAARLDRTPVSGPASVSSVHDRSFTAGNTNQTSCASVAVEPVPLHPDNSKLSLKMLRRVRSRGRQDIRATTPNPSAPGESSMNGTSADIPVKTPDPVKVEVAETSFPTSHPNKETRVEWGFSDPYCDLRSTYGRLGNADRHQRFSSNQPFHHRAAKSDAANPCQAPFMAELIEAAVALDRTLAPSSGVANLPPASFVPLKSPSVADPAMREITDKFDPLKLPDDGSGNTTRPFVNPLLANQPCGFDDMCQAPVVADGVSAPHNEADDSMEVKRVVGEWVSYKLPLNSAERARPSSATKRPSLQRDVMDPVAFGPITWGWGKECDISALYSCPSRKRLKVSGVEPDALIQKSREEPSVRNEYPLQFAKEPPGSQHVTVGTVKGELAGMVVAPDPYAFDDEMDDASLTPTGLTSSGITLKKGATFQHPPTASPNPPWPHPVPSHLSNSLADCVVVKSESHALPGRSQLETLLTQNTSSPLGGADVPAATTFHGSRMMTESDLKFSMDDLDRGMFDDEEAGVPTPPDDADEPLKHVRMTYQHPAPTSILSDPATDLQRIYPTPPSLEPYQAFSPEVRPTIGQVSASDVTLSPKEKGVLGDPDRGDRTGEEVTLQLDASKQVEVLCKAGRASKYPAPELYQPVTCLPPYLPPPGLAYTPTWQLPPIPPPMPVLPASAASDYLNDPPVTPATPITSGVTPGTPGRSIKTPASVPAPSPAPTLRTPGRVGVASVEIADSPASSMATPSSHRTPRRAYFDQNGNAAVFMNLLLSDSVMNLFRDRSFDQCAICVCNTNIAGADVGLGYLPAMSAQEEEFTCTCGFSAVRNRIASVGSGLFLEDELDVVGKRFENIIIESRPYPSSRNATSGTAVKTLTNASSVEEAIVRLVMDQSSSPFSIMDLDLDQSSKNSQQAACEANIVAEHDVREAFAQALSGGLMAMDHPVRVDVDSVKSPIHPWKESQCDVLVDASALDIYRLLVSLKPVLQDAIQRKRTSRSFGFTQHVKGPLTWREFCKEAGKSGEPQPIPLFVVGHDQDWTCVSPHALRYWEKLLLEPYSRPRDVAYIAVCPNDGNALASTPTFFKQLCSVYESCRLGRLRPINKALANGILKVGGPVMPGQPEANGDVGMMEFINTSLRRDGVVITDDEKRKLELYVRACVCELGQLLRNESSLEIFSLYVSESRSRMAQANLGPNASVNRAQQSVHSNDTQARHMNHVPGATSSAVTSSARDNRASALTSYNASTAASIVLYFLDPFNGSLSSCLWRCFLKLQSSLPRPLRDHVSFQILPMERVLQATSSTAREPFIQDVRSLAFNTFARCKKVIPHEVRARSMTDFGPAAKEREIVKRTETPEVASLYSPPYILHVPHKRMFEESVLSKPDEDLDVLFVSYCLSHNQRYLLAAATDQCGELMETCCINITAPPKRLLVSRKHRVSVRGEAIKKLWQFCVETATQLSTRPWRVVIGRLGRLSHGEIRDWSKYLNRKSLMAVGKPAGCSQCKLQHTTDSSFIVSACLTSMEPDGALMLMPDVVQANNFGRSNVNSSQNTQLKTPDDVSCTHIYVFPTSAAVQPPTEYQAGTEEDAGPEIPEDLMLHDDDEDFFFNELNSLIGDPASPTNNQSSFFGDDVIKAPTTETNGGTTSEDTQLSQQPLALGYLVSTAPPGPLPPWFWATCPGAERRCPVFLRSALHIQTSIVEPGNIGVNGKKHPLDSNKTAVILRFVLESYNALSWLSRDPVTHDRRSCLPVHCLSLMQLYRLIQNLL